MQRSKDIAKRFVRGRVDWGYGAEDELAVRIAPLEEELVAVTAERDELLRHAQDTCVNSVIDKILTEGRLARELLPAKYREYMKRIEDGAIYLLESRDKALEALKRAHASLQGDNSRLVLSAKLAEVIKTLEEVPN